MQHHGAELRALTGSPEFVDLLARDWRRAVEGGSLPAGIRPAFRSLAAYADRLTGDPAGASEEIEHLRRAGWDDEAILHACEVVSYFNFVNRMADGLGVRLEADWPHPLIGEPMGEGADSGSPESRGVDAKRKGGA